MKAILVKYHGPGNVKGSRFIARAEGVPTFTVHYDHAINADANAQHAAECLAARESWLKDGHLNETPGPDYEVKHFSTKYEPCRRPTACRGPNCPSCGYTRGDCQVHMDHSLCTSRSSRPEPEACEECKIR